MAKIATNKHHRKPRCLGGTSEPRNVSVVDKKRHDAWTLIFTRKTPEEIVEEINIVLFENNMYRFIVERKTTIKKPAGRRYQPSKITVFDGEPKIEPFIHLEKKISAWNFFSRDLTPGEFSKAKKLAREITAIWLDPDYEMSVEKIRR